MRPELERRKIALDWIAPTAAVTVEADKNQIEQVLVNVLQNAMEAIQGEGKLGVRLDASGSFPELTVRDDGPGIPASVAGKLFTPFYSTKKDGQGVGLTLSREILSKHGFDFSLTNVSSGGAEFRIVFRA